MNYDKFIKILNNKIFEESKSKLIEKISKNPDRYIGLFRPTGAKAKLIQNLTQSNEIKFGDAFEILIEEYLKENNFKILNKKFIYKDKDLNIDQHFEKDNKKYFVEQKIRDDHDSTKKRGQTNNFEKKIKLLLDKYNKKELVGIIYFIDPNLSKNKKYYEEEIKKMENDYGVELHLFYGSEFFDFLGLKWNEVLKYLKNWKENLPDIPEINFDKNPNKTFKEIKNLSPQIFNKVFSNKEIFNEIILTLFPDKKVLKLLLKHFEENSKQTIYKNLHDLLKNNN